MLGQQRAKIQPQEGIVELSDEQLEGISGGDLINSESRYRYALFDEEVLQYEFQTRLKNGTLGVPIVVPKRQTTDPRYRG
jgi:hypothetical protein